MSSLSFFLFVGSPVHRGINCEWLSILEGIFFFNSLGRRVEEVKHIPAELLLCVHACVKVYMDKNL